MYRKKQMHATKCGKCNKVVDHLVNNDGHFTCCWCETVKKIHVPRLLIRRELGFKTPIKVPSSYNLLIIPGGEHNKEHNLNMPCICKYNIPDSNYTITSDDLDLYSMTLNGSMTVTAVRGTTSLKASCVNSGPWTITAV